MIVCWKSKIFSFLFLIMDYEIPSTIDLNYAIRNYNIFRGTFFSNTVPIINLKATQALIVITQNNNEPGKHWTVLIVYKSSCIFFIKIDKKFIQQLFLLIMRNPFIHWIRITNIVDQILIFSSFFVILTTCISNSSS